MLKCIYLKINKLPHRRNKIGNDLETSELLQVAVFYLTKNAYYSVCKDNTLLPNNKRFLRNIPACALRFGKYGLTP